MKAKANKIFTIAYVLIILIVFIFGNLPISIATTKEELNQQSNNIDNQINQKNNEKNKVETQISSEMAEIQKLNLQIAEYESEIGELDVEITELSGKIEEAEIKLKEQEEKYKEQQELLEKRLVGLYEAGPTSYLDVLLNSKSLTQFLSNYYLIETLVECDQNLLDSIEKLKNEIADTKTGLENDKSELENNKETLETKSQALQTIKNERTSKVASLNAEEKSLQSDIEQMEADKREIQSRLAAIIAAESISYEDNISDTPSASGYISPIAGLDSSDIDTPYGNYRTISGFHTGADFEVGSGTPVRAVKSGTVVTSRALYNSYGGYRSYGEYIIINHHDGTMTLYAHGSPGSRNVSEGEEVSQGEVIMLSGTTGNSTGPHLHFEVRVNSSPVNPAPYLP